MSEEKDSQRLDIRARTKLFEASGGKIEQIPLGHVAKREGRGHVLRKFSTRGQVQTEMIYTSTIRGGMRD